MPVCRSTASAVSRSRIAVSLASTSKVLVPFLYQTATIQQWKPAVHLIARRNASSRSTPDEDIPFEDSTSSLPIVENAQPSRKPTITGSERAAFQKLYKRFNNEENPHDGIPFRHEVDQIADEWYEEDDDKDASPSLDTVFDAVLSGLPPPARYKRPRQPADNLKTFAEKILKTEVEAARKKPREEVAAEAARVKMVREEDRARVQGLMEQAHTDRELWEILQSEVFDLIRQLDLDGSQKATERQDNEGKLSSSARSSLSRRSTSRKTDVVAEARSFPTSTAATATAWNPDRNKDPRYDPRVLFPNFPSHLVFATRILRANFPSSTLPLSILPTIKSLGRSSYALGASSSLYNLLIRTAWLQQASYDYIDELLTDMDNGGIEFNAGTLALLEDILDEHQRGTKGRFGPSLQSIWSMDHFIEGTRRLRAWRKVAAQRLGTWTEQRASEGKVIRKYDFKLGFRGASSRNAKFKGPRDQVRFPRAPRVESQDLDEIMPETAEMLVANAAKGKDAEEIDGREIDSGLDLLLQASQQQKS